GARARCGSLRRGFPVFVATSRTEASLLIASRVIQRKLLLLVEGICDQFEPFVVLKIPPPRIESRLPNASPVPAYRMSGSVGSMTRLVTARFDRKSSAGAQ